MSEYRAWQALVQRCTAPTNPNYKRYGALGITVCAGWLAGPKAFLVDMGKKPTHRHELDRKRNEDGYWCGHCEECTRLGRAKNCHWVTRSQNDRNRRTNRRLTFRGETRVLVEWCERLALSRNTIGKRLASGWSVERALETPVLRRAGATT